MRDYHILFSSNRNYFPFIFVTCQSILDNLETTPDDAQEHLIFHLLIDETVPEREYIGFTQNFSKLNADCKVSFEFAINHYDPQPLQSIEKYRPLTKSNIHISSYYRLLFSETLPPLSANFLYLDIDIMVLGDVRELFHRYTLENKILAAVAHPSFFHFLQNKPKTGIRIVLRPRDLNSKLPRITIPTEDYFNAGLLLINRDMWDKEQVTLKCLTLGLQWETPLLD